MYDKPIPDSESVAARLERLSVRNPETGCLEWTGATSNCGYGRICIARKSLEAHRVAFVIAFAPIPKGMCVCHTCDNPKCIEPSHLWLGTHQDNMADAVKKGRRGGRGGGGRQFRLSDAAAIDVRRRAQRGEPAASIAAEYRVSPTLVWNIKHGKTMKHLENAQ